MTEQMDVARHPVLLEQLTRECPNSICRLESSHRIGRYSCLMHALDFTEKKEYIAIATYPGLNVFAGAEFAQWLIDRGHLIEVPQENAGQGDLIMYFNESHFKHIGILLDGRRVVSKWGVGHLYEHALWEVPESYGTGVQFFRSLVYDDAIDYFTDFAEEKGIPFKNADS